MGKKLVSFRMDERRIEELRELANVYTNGNATDLVEFLISRMYFLEPLALQGKYRTPGFGIAGKERERVKSAWDTWMNSCTIKAKPDTAQANVSVRVTINGDITSLKRSEIRELAHLLRIPIDTRCVYTISVKQAPEREEMSTYRVKYTYLEYSNNIHGRRESGYDEFEAENAQDAVEQCRREFYISSNVHITSVSKWSPYGYWIPISDNAWV